MVPFNLRCFLFCFFLLSSFLHFAKASISGIIDLKSKNHWLKGAEWDDFWISGGYVWDASMKTNEIVYLRMNSTQYKYSYYVFSAWEYKNLHIKMDLPIHIQINEEEIRKFRYGVGWFKALNNIDIISIIPVCKIHIKLQHSFEKPINPWLTFDENK